jgi:hypothetical protein
LDFVFEKETTAIYSGGTFLVSAIERKEVCLHTSDCALAEKYGMEERNAGEYHMRVKLNEVEEITQKWIPLGEYKQQSPESNRQTNGRFRTSGKTAIYRNTEYEFFYDIEKNRCAIISYRTKSDLENGFSEVDPSSDRLIKYVSLEDLDFVFEKESTAIYKGDLFRADSILTDKIVLSTGDRDLEKKYNMKQWDRGYYFIHANLKDVERITQEWIPLEKYNKHIFAREDI